MGFACARGRAIHWVSMQQYMAQDGCAHDQNEIQRQRLDERESCKAKERESWSKGGHMQKIHSDAW